MVELAARVGHLRMSAGDLQPGLVPVAGALLLAGEGALRLLQALLGPTQEARAVDLRPVGEDGEVPETEIDTHLGRGLGQHLFRAGLDDEAREIPARAVLDHRHRGRRRRQRARPLHLQVADLRQTQLLPRRDRPAGVRGEPHRLPGVLAGLVPGRAHARALALQAGEEVPVRGVQVPQGLLKDDRRDLAEPGPLRGVLRLGDQLLRQVAGLRERHARVAGGLPRPECVVVDHPRAPERPCQRRALTGARVQAEAVPKLHADHATQLVYGYR